MKTTAVEWLETQIVKFHNWKLNPIYDKNCFDEIELTNAIQKAKEMEKQQIIDAWYDGQNDHEREVEMHAFGENYYNDIIKSEENGK